MGARPRGVHDGYDTGAGHARHRVLTMKPAFAYLMLIVLVAAVTPAAAAQDTLVYELAAVAGDYPIILPSGEPRFYRSQTIEYHGPLARIEAMRVAIEGESETGLIVCDFYPPDLDTVVTGMDISTSIRRMSLFEYWLGGDVVYDNGAFSAIGPMHPMANHSFEYLHDGESYVVTQDLAPEGYVSVCRAIAPDPWQEGRIDRAVLYIDVTYPIATEPTTWGRIKALYQ